MWPSKQVWQSPSGILPSKHLRMSLWNHEVMMMWKNYVERCKTRVATMQLKKRTGGCKLWLIPGESRSPVRAFLNLVSTLHHHPPNINVVGYLWKLEFRNLDVSWCIYSFGWKWLDLLVICWWSPRHAAQVMWRPCSRNSSELGGWDSTKNCPRKEIWNMI